jgi:Dolichyl-phosphate-mannose-protein mannosyltransferase
MLLALPLFGFALLLDRYWQPRRDVREAFLAAAITWGVTTVLLTELLSLIGGLRMPGLAICWVGLAGGAAVWALWGKAPLREREVPLVKPGRMSAVLAAPVALVVAVTAVVANLGRPNNSDSMVYHLARVMHWVQNGGVADYPSNINRQLYNPPWAEYAVLQALLLGGDDRFANLVQWFSMLGCLVGVTLVAKKLGAGRRGQLIAALFGATLPMGILQASSTQNDYVTAFWLICLAVGVLGWRERPESPPAALAVGASLGLALLTKTSAYLFAAPLLLLLLPRTRPGPASLRAAALIGLVALALNAPFYARNVELYGALLGPHQPGAGSMPSSASAVTNEAMSPAILVSSLTRNLAIHLGTPLPAVNRGVEQVIRDLHSTLGVDPDDRRTTWSDFIFAVLPPEPRENTAGNLLHMLLIAVALGLGLASPSLRANGRAAAYAGALALGFVLFCLVLKWQPTHSRLHLPLFVLWAPFVGLALEGLRPLVLGLGALLLVAWSRPFLLDNWSHPLVGEYSIFLANRRDQYFFNIPDKQDDYLGATDSLRRTDCRDVGLILSWHDWEYPIWALLPEARESGRIEHVGVSDLSARLAARRPSFEPCAVLAVGAPDAELILVEGWAYRLSWVGRAARVYAREGG